MVGRTVGLDEVPAALDANGPTRQSRRHRRPPGDAGSAGRSPARSSRGSMKIGFIGAGRMGRPMLDRLAAAGHDVTVLVRRPEARAAAEADGLTCADHVRRAARERSARQAREQRAVRGSGRAGDRRSPPRRFAGDPREGDPGRRAARQRRQSSPRHRRRRRVGRRPGRSSKTSATARPMWSVRRTGPASRIWTIDRRAAVEAMNASTRKFATQRAHSPR